jgi:putative spermidine/putrescine transport system permease protein
VISTTQRPVRIAVLLGILFGVLLPLVPLFVWSVSHGWWFPDILPSALSGRAWSYVFSLDSGVAEAIGNTLLVSLLVCLLCVVLGVPAGRALGLYQFPGKRVVEFVILAPLIVPPLAVVMGIHVFFIRNGLVDTLMGVVISHLIPALPYMIVVMKSVFTNYDPAFEQQARSLGARKYQTIYRVTLPLVYPGILTGSLFVILISWSQYILTLLIGGGRVVTLPVLLFSFASAGDNALTGALSVLFLLPAAVILLLTSRLLTGRSLAIGAAGKL